MTVYYKGLNCLTDKGSAQYMAYMTESQAAVNYYEQGYYGKVTVYFASASIFVMAVKYFFFWIRDRRYLKQRENANVFTALVYVVAAYCRLIGYRRTPRFLVALSFPASMGNTIYACGTSLYLFCYALVPHFWYRACRGFGSPPLAIRAGAMAMAPIPFIFALSGKLNIISMLTGIGYEKLNWVHQFAGVACLVLSVIHTIPFIYQALAEGGSDNLNLVFKGTDYITGIAALVPLVLLCLLFKREIRLRLYELAFHAHWFLGCCFFVGTTYHVYGMLDMQNYMWATLAVWVVQWVFRVIRQRGVGRKYKAEIRRTAPGVFEVVIDNARGTWRPSQHCFLRFPGGRVFDNHPFTIASVTADSRLRFLVRAQSGLTRKIYDLLDSEVGTASKSVIVDGPYGGCPRDLQAFDKVLLVATGVGITCTLPCLVNLTAAPGPEVDFVWVARDFEEVAANEKQLAQCSARANIKVFVTQSGSASGLSSEKTSVNEKSFEVSSELQSSGVQIVQGRPHLERVLQALELSLRRRNAVVCCGSASMAEEVCNAVARMQLHVISLRSSYVEEVYLHSETYGW